MPTMQIIIIVLGGGPDNFFVSYSITVSLLWDGIGILFVAHMKSGNAQKRALQ